MANLNKVFLIGRLTADIELRHTPNNTPVASFSIAVNRRYTKQGEQTQADFINIVCWDKQAEFVSKYFRKGSSIFVSGAIQQRKWQDKEGNNRYSFEIIADDVQFTESKSSSSEYNSDSGNTFVNTAQDDFKEIGADEELPF